MFRVMFIISILFLGCGSDYNKTKQTNALIDVNQGKSLLGNDLIQPSLDNKKDQARIDKYKEALAIYKKNPNADNLIWYGRRMAYLGDYKKAIDIFTQGISDYPNDARMYRHRGHRYISLRQIDKAISDLEYAASMIKGQKDIIEPDGIPNKRQTPVSTLQGNIWYHLGLAYYLQNNMEKALPAFEQCLVLSTFDDMKVATSHWLYMILRRMDNIEAAKNILNPITKDLDVFENMAYHQLLLFYKGELDKDVLLKNGKNEIDYMNAGVIYGYGNWLFYNNQKEEAKVVFDELVKQKGWAAFGFIAAEADLSRM